ETGVLRDRQAEGPQSRLHRDSQRAGRLLDDIAERALEVDPGAVLTHVNILTYDRTCQKTDTTLRKAPCPSPDPTSSPCRPATSMLPRRSTSSTWALFVPPRAHLRPCSSRRS